METQGERGDTVCLVGGAVIGGVLRGAIGI
jgi:hypothetical protein